MRPPTIVHYEKLAQAYNTARDTSKLDAGKARSIVEKIVYALINYLQSPSGLVVLDPTSEQFFENNTIKFTVDVTVTSVNKPVGVVPVPFWVRVYPDNIVRLWVDDDEESDAVLVAEPTALIGLFDRVLRNVLVPAAVDMGLRARM